jgi:Domain of unknown function (DUF4350)
MKKALPIFITVGFFAVFAFGIFQLFQLRFEAGDVYPPYSSLRSDPLGAMAFYESIDKLPGISVQRDFSSDNRLPDTPATTYLHLAADPYEWDRLPEDEFLAVETFIKGGGRLVITFQPESAETLNWYHHAISQTNATPSTKGATNSSAPLGGKTNPKKAKKPIVDEDEEIFKTVSIQDRWGVGFDAIDLVKDSNDVYAPEQVKNRTDLPLPATLEWHSGVVLTNLSKEWQKIYTRGFNAVVAERKFGHGSVVFATDSYFVSNEAMLKDRHADFLAWLVGPAKTIVFDEAHFGVVETSGVAGLMRKYRLYWLVGGLILLAALFIWKNSMSLVPPHEDEKPREYLVGKEAASGFVNLLRRNISPTKLLETCFAEWKKSALSAKCSPARVRQAEVVFTAENSLPVRDRNLIRAYRDISAALNTKRNSNPTTKT